MFANASGKTPAICWPLLYQLVMPNAKVPEASVAMNESILATVTRRPLTKPMMPPSVSGRARTASGQARWLFDLQSDHEHFRDAEHEADREIVLTRGERRHHRRARAAR